MLACVFDVHGNLPALEAVLDDAAGRGAERFLLGGDYAAFGGSPRECVERLAGLDAVVRLRGNWERWVADPPPEVRADADTMAVAEAVHDALGPQRVAELGALPPDAPLGDALVCHAGPGDDMRSVPPEPSEDDSELLAGVTARRLIVGHTHVAFARTVDGVELVNPGSVGLPLDGDRRAAYALLHDNGRVEHLRVDYDLEAAISQLLEFAGDAAWGAEIAGRLQTAGAR